MARLLHLNRCRSANGGMSESFTVLKECTDGQEQAVFSFVSKGESTMKHLKTTLMGAAIGGALLFAGQATAGPITVDGIEFSSGSNFQSTLIYENTVSAPGEELMGFGLITAINGDLDYCASGGSGDCELTFVFDGFVVDTIDPNHVTFDFGSVRFYADSMADFDGFDMSTAENGDLFLEATGHEYEETDSGETGTLIATG
jgi:hypothetical protein